MTSSNSDTSRSRCREFLSRIPISELTSIRVAVKRHNVTTSGPGGPILRNIEDPQQLIALVHNKKDDTRRLRGIFDRDDISVNQEERFVSTETDKPRNQQSSNSVTYSRSHSGTPRRRTRSRSRSRSPNRDRRNVIDREKNTDRDKRVDPRRSSEKERGRVSDREKERSSERDRDKRPYKSRPYSRERDDERYRRRSRTPLRPGEYRPTHSESKRKSSSRDRDHLHDKYRTHSRRSRSHSVDYRKPSTSRKPSRSPRRSVTPVRDRDRQKSPRYEPGKSRRSRSPPKPEKSHYSDKRGREPSPSYKDSSKRRSRSSSRYERDKRRSRSPRNVEGTRRGSPGRYERYSSRRHSRSPARHDTHRSSPDRRCRSPHPPIVTFSRARSPPRRSSRSPGYDRERRYYKHGRSRSRSPRKLASHEENEAAFAFYEGIPGSEYWIPGPIRPGFPAVPRYYPPAFFPRMPGAPIIFPPRIPMVAPYPPPYRQRLPVYNSKHVSKTSPETTVGESAVSTSSQGNEAVAGTSTQEEQGNVTIQEVSDSDSHRSDKKNQEEETRDNVQQKD